MKPYFLAVGAFLLTLPVAQAQTTPEVPTLNLLEAPSSPAFVLMGIEPATIEKPTNLTDLSLAVNNATQGFTALPQNFALQFSPYWMLRDNGKRLTYQQYNSNHVADILPQTLQVSLGVAQPETQALAGATKLGVGMKFSLLRGTLDTAVTQALAARQRAADLENATLTSRILELTRTKYGSVVPNPTTDPAGYKSYQEDINNLDALVREEPLVRATRQRAMQRLAEVPFARYGWKLDVAGGLALDFPDKRFNNSRVDRWGVWLTGGYELPRGHWSVLGVARLLTSPSAAELTPTQTSFDAGARIIYNKVLRQKGAISVEYAHRTITKGRAESSDRYVFNLEYPFLPNQLLTLSLGRNFDGTALQEGNLIAALNLVFGLGAKRNIVAAP